MKTCYILLLPLLFAACSTPEASVEGEMKQWHPVQLTFEGPATGEAAPTNPFRDYRLDIVFEHAQSGTTYRVPGYYAADGNAGETGAEEGNQWRVRFTPDQSGTWSYTAFFRTGPDVALAESSESGEPTSFDGATGSFEIQESDAVEPDFRATGLLRYVGERYLRFDNGRYFIKGGADSPENFLAYHEFDGTYSVKQPGTFQAGEATTAPLHRYEPHLVDWQPGDPTWQGDKGKAIIGALNYLASEGMNSVYFLTMNVEGDGGDVWPWTAPDARDRYDVSKLDQWNIVFDHMDRLGLALHVVLTETENETLFERYDTDSDFADTRKLYYRELIARFGYHPALVWNLGEENGWDDREKETTGESGIPNTDEQRKAFASYIHELDPYDHPVVVHTLPGQYDRIYTPLLGYADLEGPSLQMGNMQNAHAETLKWIEQSAEAGKPWFVSLDEIGPAHTGVTPDGEGNNHDEVRNHALWGNLMAGGAGVEWYFGYQYPHNDLGMEDWRSRDRLWDYTRYALEFFNNHLPFSEMSSQDELTPREDDYVLAIPGEIYAVYLPNGRSSMLALEDGNYSVEWYNPREGGELVSGSVETVPGPLGAPPSDPELDWVVLVRRAE